MIKWRNKMIRVRPYTEKERERERNKRIVFFLNNNKQKKRLLNFFKTPNKNNYNVLFKYVFFNF